ncbi:uncharacterized protein Dmoj_GI26485 [Drosophila mojavensis]|uniref:Uncharacterized protein n=1 Tax=Drosophila mojavensis TaxID=7230 RepID=A0A0Q9X7Y7_DROMO|nr:uncharacterized protein Dmoj_GI26485 [Drosophila mojavensis]
MKSDCVCVRIGSTESAVTEKLLLLSLSRKGVNAGVDANVNVNVNAKSKSKVECFALHVI